MFWKKLGQIFDPSTHKLPKQCTAFAQSPQALVFDDFVRVYFSTRMLDKNGKYLSLVAYVDFDKDFKSIRAVAQEPVIALGGPGCFDEHGIFPMNVLRDGNKIIAYTTGWSRRVSVSAEASIGYAVSNDQGLTFEKLGQGPVLGASLLEPFLVSDAFVSKIGERYYMWYIYGCKWFCDPYETEPQRVYRIAQAQSVDGVHWQRDSKQLIETVLDENECQALPSVIKIDDCYHMYFCYRHATGFRSGKQRSYRLGYARSMDLVNWIRDDKRGGLNRSESGWDSQMLCYPHIFRCDEQIYLLYNGNEFGKTGFGMAQLVEL